MAYENNIPQHKNIAEGNGNMAGQDFGCKPHDHSKGPLMAPISDGMKGHVADGEKRGEKPPIASGDGKFAKQAAPDHGSHHGKR